MCVLNEDGSCLSSLYDPLACLYYLRDISNVQFD